MISLGKIKTKFPKRSYSIRKKTLPDITKKAQEKIVRYRFIIFLELAFQ